MDVAQVGIAVVVGLVVPGTSGYVGIRVGQALLKQELEAFKLSFSEWKTDHVVTSKEWKQEIGNAISVHKAETTKIFERVVFQDSCLICGTNGKERHAEIVRRIEGLESSFKSCFDDLVQALKH